MNDGTLLPALVQAIGAVMAAAVGGIITHRFASRQRSIYEQRDNSDGLWYHDLARSQDIVFIGISHSSLHVYLREILKLAPSSSTINSIKLIYSNADDGSAWEGAAFLSNLRNSRHTVASLLCSSEWRRVSCKFDSVVFLQSTHLLPFGGTALDCGGGVLYILHYLPHQVRNAKKTITFRYQNYVPRFLPRPQRNLMNVYSSAFQDVEENGRKLGEFKRSIWDDSVREWSAFCRKCRAHQESMRHLLKVAKLNGNETVLDLASGTGDISGIILEEYPGITLTTLDASPRMIEHCKLLLGNRVNAALSKVPPAPDEAVIDIEGMSFDVVIIHLSVPAVAKTRDELMGLARWCRTINGGGQLLLAIHNTAVRMPDIGHEITDDHVRRAIHDELKKMGKGGAYKSPASSCFQPQDVKNALVDAGYRCVETHQMVFPMQMSERLLMWKAPAVLDSLVRLDELEGEEIRMLYENVKRVLDNEPTPDMGVMYWAFVPANVDASGPR